MSTMNGYDARAVANYFLTLAQRDHEPLDPMKLQKLVYLAHGWSLALRGKPLIRQNVEAWPYGPVIRDLYVEFKDYHAAPIQSTATAEGSVSDPDDQVFLQNVWDTYKKYSGLQLSNLTHEPGSAWDIVTKKSAWPKPTISNQLIASEFLRRNQQG